MFVLASCRVAIAAFNQSGFSSAFPRVYTQAWIVVFESMSDSRERLSTLAHLWNQCETPDRCVGGNLTPLGLCTRSATCVFGVDRCLLFAWSEWRKVAGESGEKRDHYCFPTCCLLQRNELCVGVFFIKPGFCGSSDFDKAGTMMCCTTREECAVLVRTAKDEKKTLMRGPLIVELPASLIHCAPSGTRSSGSFCRLSRVRAHSTRGSSPRISRKR